MSISKVIGCIASGQVGWVLWRPLMSLYFFELAISEEGEPKMSLWEKKDSA